MGEEMRLLSPPMIFWNYINNEEWNNLSIEEQDKLVEIAKDNLDKNEYR